MRISDWSSDVCSSDLTIEQKLRTLEASGGIERMNAELTRRTEAGVRRPRPVAGIALAVRARSWIFDPAMVVEKDIFDNKGNAIARAGQRVNPMDFVTIRQKLVFIDGDDKIGRASCRERVCQYV